MDPLVLRWILKKLGHTPESLVTLLYEELLTSAEQRVDLNGLLSRTLALTTVRSLAQQSFEEKQLISGESSSALLQLHAPLSPLLP